MKNLKLSHFSQKKGNAVIILVSILIVLAILLGFFLKTTVNRTYAVKKLGDALMARELANSIAILSIHYLKNEELRNPNSEFRKFLSLPKSEFLRAGGKEGFIDLNKLSFANSVGILNYLKQQEQSDLKIKNDVKPRWTVQAKENFQFYNDCYPREKFGSIYIDFDITFELPGTRKTKTESYHFVSEVKVVANILPVLSKFTLYVTDALKGGNDVNRFNVVDSDVNGNLISNKVQPWVLNNGGGADIRLNTYETLVESNRGFIFLGGGLKNKPIQLGIAYGEIDGRSLFGEGFHFYSNGNSYWKTLEAWSADKGIMTANLGLCFDPSDVTGVGDYGYNAYFKLLGNDFNWARRNSILKLYGTDEFPSPTLVFGYVDSMCLSIREYRDGSDKDDFYFLDYYSEDMFSDALDDDEDLAYFADRYKEKWGRELNYRIYRAYSSNILSVRYNNDYGYALDSSKDWPINTIVTGDKFKDLCNIAGKSNDDVVYSVPSTNDAKFDNIYPGVKLNEFNNFTNIETLQIGKNGRKTAYSLTFLTREDKEKVSDSMVVINPHDEIEIDKDFKKFLKAKGTLMEIKSDPKYDQVLNPNGWIYLDSDELDSDFKLPLKFNKVQLISQGGIVLSNGNIYIKENIESKTPELFLTIVALKGDIIIKRGVNKIQASLVSKQGQVRFEDDGGNPIEINGQIVMQNLGDGNKKADQDVGINRRLKLNYINELSAKPYKDTEVESEQSEKPLLMYYIKDNPKLY